MAREPFVRLPLHVDTGFYVSNHTISKRRIDFSKGWNAHYAGCSKLLPELFYSLIYLKHSRAATDKNNTTPSTFRGMSRRYSSLVNFAAGIACGFLACIWNGGDITYYYLGLVCYSLISTEALWGGYFECAELLEVPFQVGGLACLSHGLATSSSGWIFAGATLWAVDVFFIKLSSMFAAGILFLGLGLLYSETVIGSVQAFAAFAALFLLWIRFNRKSVSRLLSALWGHESNYGQGADWRRLSLRVVEKCHCLALTAARQPILPALALIGLAIGPPLPVLYWLYALSVCFAYVVQAANCRYYMLPMLPVIALPAAAGAIAIAHTSVFGLCGLVALGVIWLLRNPRAATRLGPKSLNEIVWRGYISDSAACSNLALEKAAEELVPVISSGTLLVYGPLTQAYLLIGAGYPTPIVTPEYYLDDVCPEWQGELNERLIDSPPAFILDTSASFDSAAARAGLGLTYQLTHVFGRAFRLFKLKSVSLPTGDTGDVVTHRPIPRQQQENDLHVAGDRVTFHNDPLYTGPFVGESAGKTDESTLGKLLNDLKNKGHQRLAVYGAGRFTIRHAEAYRNSPVPIAMVLDDSAGDNGTKFLDWPLHHPTDVDTSTFDGIVISTDRFAVPMLSQVRKQFGDRMPAYVC
jgi:hypothetical protein